MQIHADVQHKTVQTGGVTTRYFTFGHGPRQLVILPGLSVQSVMGAAEAVARDYQCLAKDFTVLLPDRRQQPPAGYTMDQMARDTAAALQAAGCEHACFFGASQGGMLAMLIAARHPQLVEKLALGSTAARLTPAAQAVVARWIDLARQENAPALYAAFGQAIYPPAVWEQARPLLAEAARTVTREELARFVVLAGALPAFNGARALASVTCPVLLLGDDRDELFGLPAMEEMAGCLQANPRVETHVTHGYGHAAYDLAPGYKERLADFFA